MYNAEGKTGLSEESIYDKKNQIVNTGSTVPIVVKNNGSQIHTPADKKGQYGNVWSFGNNLPGTANQNLYFVNGKFSNTESTAITYNQKTKKFTITAPQVALDNAKFQETFMGDNMKAVMNAYKVSPDTKLTMADGSQKTASELITQYADEMPNYVNAAIVISTFKDLAKNDFGVSLSDEDATIASIYTSKSSKDTDAVYIPRSMTSYFDKYDSFDSDNLTVSQADFKEWYRDELLDDNHVGNAVKELGEKISGYVAKKNDISSMAEEDVEEYNSEIARTVSLWRTMEANDLDVSAPQGFMNAVGAIGVGFIETIGTAALGLPTIAAGIGYAGTNLVIGAIAYLLPGDDFAQEYLDWALIDKKVFDNDNPVEIAKQILDETWAKAFDDDSLQMKALGWLSKDMMQVDDERLTSLTVIDEDGNVINNPYAINKNTLREWATQWQQMKADRVSGFAVGAFIGRIIGYILPAIIINAIGEEAGFEAGKMVANTAAKSARTAVYEAAAANTAAQAISAAQFADAEALAVLLTNVANSTAIEAATSSAVTWGVSNLVNFSTNVAIQGLVETLMMDPIQFTKFVKYGDKDVFKTLMANIIQNAFFEGLGIGTSSLNKYAREEAFILKHPKVAGAVHKFAKFGYGVKYKAGKTYLRMRGVDIGSLTEEELSGLSKNLAKSVYNTGVRKAEYEATKNVLEALKAFKKTRNKELVKQALEVATSKEATKIAVRQAISEELMEEIDDATVETIVRVYTRGSAESFEKKMSAEQLSAYEKFRQALNDEVRLENAVDLFSSSRGQLIVQDLILSDPTVAKAYGEYISSLGAILKEESKEKVLESLNKIGRLLPEDTIEYIGRSVELDFLANSMGRTTLEQLGISTKGMSTEEIIDSLRKAVAKQSEEDGVERSIAYLINKVGRENGIIYAQSADTFELLLNRVARSREALSLKGEEYISLVNNLKTTMYKYQKSIIDWGIQNGVLDKKLYENMRATGYWGENADMYLHLQRYGVETDAQKAWEKYRTVETVSSPFVEVRGNTRVYSYGDLSSDAQFLDPTLVLGEELKKLSQTYIRREMGQALASVDGTASILTNAREVAAAKAVNKDGVRKDIRKAVRDYAGGKNVRGRQTKSGVHNVLTEVDKNMNKNPVEVVANMYTARTKALKNAAELSNTGNIENPLVRTRSSADAIKDPAARMVNGAESFGITNKDLCISFFSKPEVDQLAEEMGEAGYRTDYSPEAIDNFEEFVKELGSSQKSYLKKKMNEKGVTKDIPYVNTMKRPGESINKRLGTPPNFEQKALNLQRSTKTFYGIDESIDRTTLLDAMETGKVRTYRVEGDPDDTIVFFTKQEAEEQLNRWMSYDPTFKSKIKTQVRSTSNLELVNGKELRLRSADSQSPSLKEKLEMDQDEYIPGDPTHSLAKTRTAKTKASDLKREYYRNFAPADKEAKAVRQEISDAVYDETDGIVSQEIEDFIDRETNKELGDRAEREAKRYFNEANKSGSIVVYTTSRKDPIHGTEVFTSKNAVRNAGHRNAYAHIVEPDKIRFVDDGQIDVAVIDDDSIRQSFGKKPIGDEVLTAENYESLYRSMDEDEFQSEMQRRLLADKGGEAKLYSKDSYKKMARARRLSLANGHHRDIIEDAYDKIAALRDTLSNPKERGTAIKSGFSEQELKDYNMFDQDGNGLGTQVLAFDNSVDDFYDAVDTIGGLIEENCSAAIGKDLRLKIESEDNLLSITLKEAGMTGEVEEYYKYLALSSLTDTEIENMVASQVEAYMKNSPAARNLTGKQINTYQKEMTRAIKADLQNRLDMKTRALMDSGNDIFVDVDQVYGLVDSLRSDIMGKYGLSQNSISNVVEIVGDNGVSQYVKLDPVMATVYRYVPKISDAPRGFGKVLQGLNSLFRKVSVTYNPASYLRQWPKDFQNAWVTTGANIFFDGRMSKLIGSDATSILSDAFVKEAAYYIVPQLKRELGEDGWKALEEVAQTSGKSIERVAVEFETNVRTDAILGNTASRINSDFADINRGALKNFTEAQRRFSEIKTEPGYMTSRRIREKKKLLKQTSEYYDKITGQTEDAAQGLLKKISNFWKEGGIKGAQEARESYLRSLTYNAQYSKCIENGLSIQEARAWAFRASQDATTNFSRSFIFGNALCDNVPFLSAALNGTASFKRMMLLDPVGVTSRLVSLQLAYASVIVKSLSNDENRRKYKNITEYNKSGTLTWVEDGIKFEIPMPEEFTPFFNPIRWGIEKLYGTNKNSFLQLAANELLSFSAVDLDGFEDLDANDIYSSQSAWEHIGRGAEKLFSSVAPPSVKTVYMLITKRDPYTGKNIDARNSGYYLDENEVLQKQDYTQGAFVNAIADWTENAPAMFQISASAAEYLIGSLIGNAGVNALNTVADIFSIPFVDEEDRKANLKDLGNRLNDYAGGVFVDDIYSQANSDWSKLISAGYKEAEAMIAGVGSNENKKFKEISDALAKEDDPEKKKKLLSQYRSYVQTFYKKYLDQVKILEEKYGKDSYTYARQASLLSLMTMLPHNYADLSAFADNSESKQTYYNMKAMAIDGMINAGFKSPENDLSVFGRGYYDDDGNYQFKANSPLFILSINNALKGQGSVTMNNIRADFLAAGVDSDFKDKEYALESAVYDKYPGTNGVRSKSDWNKINDEIDAIRTNFNATTIPIIWKYAKQYPGGYEEFINYNIEELNNYVWVPTSYMGQGKYDSKIQKTSAYDKSYLMALFDKKSEEEK